MIRDTLIKLYNDLYYSPGDTFTIPENSPGIICPGESYSYSRNIGFIVVTPKSMRFISYITLQHVVVIIRTVDGGMVFNGAVDLTTQNPESFGAQKIQDRLIKLQFRKPYMTNAAPNDSIVSVTLLPGTSIVFT